MGGSLLDLLVPKHDLASFRRCFHRRDWHQVSGVHLQFLNSAHLAYELLSFNRRLGLILFTVVLTIGQAVFTVGGY